MGKDDHRPTFCPAAWVGHRSLLAGGYHLGTHQLSGQPAARATTVCEYEAVRWERKTRGLQHYEERWNWRLKGGRRSLLRVASPAP